MNTKKNILVFASKAVGQETFAFLLKTGAPVGRVVVGRPDDEGILAASRAAGIPAEVYSPRTQEDLAADPARYEWLLNLWSPRILKPEVLALARNRLNIHPSLVPHCLGNDNAAWAIRKRLPAGVSLIEMNPDIDHGEVYVQCEIPYSFPLRGSELHQRLQRASVELFNSAWPSIYKGDICPKPQVGPGSYHTRKHTEADRVRSAEDAMPLGEAIDWLLAHDFDPGTTAELVRDGKRYRLRLIVEPAERTG